MNSMQEILKKADVWGLRSYLLQDQPLPNCDFVDYKTYIEKTEKPVFLLLEQVFDDAKELDKATDMVSRALSAREDVYFEMGLRAGAKILYELLFRDEGV